MTYENAPATKMIAEFCACCARPLVDANSVEIGMGPVCRKTHGFAKPQEEADALLIAVLLAELPEGADRARLTEEADPRKLANLLVHRIACDQSGPAVNVYTNTIRAAGFTKLADRIAKRLAQLSIEVGEGNTIALKAPYNEQAIEAFRAIPGKRWDPIAKRTRFPEASLPQLAIALCAAYGEGASIRTATGAVITLGELRAWNPIQPNAQIALPLRVEPTIFIARRPDGRIAVRAPYDVGATDLFRAIAGRRWESATKENVFPPSAGLAVKRALEARYPGAVGVGPRGRFVVGEERCRQPPSSPYLFSCAVS